jgi:ABC-type antimicrobial peptide transport system permease subunit
MIKNYLKTAWRNMRNNKVYSTLNIVGLAAGMAVTLIIGLWVYDQYSYDKFLPNYTQVYQVKVNFTDPHDGEHTQSAVCLPLATVMRNTIPGIKHVAETDWLGNQTHNLAVKDKKLLLDGGSVHPDFLKIFQYPMVKGNVATCFRDIYSIILTQSTATALFGREDPINQTVRIDNQHDVKVTGVMADIPSNATIKFAYLLPFSYTVATQDWMKPALTQWSNNSFQIFVELQPNASITQVNAAIKNLMYKYDPQSRQVKPVILLHALKDWHLYSDFKNGKVAGGFIDYVRIFSLVGILVLIIACINFMNLSTARSEKRAREVGVRKAIGSQRLNLIVQFLTESVLITFLAFLFCIVFVQCALSYFNQLTSSNIHIPYNNGVFWLVMIGFVLLCGLLAGSRPAFYLSSFNPVRVLKGTIQIGRAAALPRKILVVFQFSCSVALIIGTTIIYQQIQYAKNRPTGYSPARLVSTGMSDDLGKNYNALKNDLLASGVVESVTKASSPMTGIYWHTGIENWPGKGAGELGINVGAVSVSDNYFKTVGEKLVLGRDFSSEWSADTSNIIINEAAVKRMGLKQPLNQLVAFDGIKGESKIIGVVRDALMDSPFKPVEPTVFNHGRGGNFIIYRLSKGAEQHHAIEVIGKIFDKYNPAYPFSYSFVDRDYDQKFNLENLVGTLAGIFAGLAIFISCLGLFGLAAYVAEQRTKEIGIRKVLGATVAQVWLLLSGDFILLVLISCLIAVPVAFYYLKHWLENYNYRIHIGVGVFVISALAAVVITLLTVSFQAIKAAVASPVKSLRSE